VAIAEARNLAAIQTNVPCPVIDEDEIVSRAVHLRETQHDCDFSGGCACCHVKRSLPLLLDYCCRIRVRDSSRLRIKLHVAGEVARNDKKSRRWDQNKRAAHCQFTF